MAELGPYLNSDVLIAGRRIGASALGHKRKREAGRTKSASHLEAGLALVSGSRCQMLSGVVARCGCALPARRLRTLTPRVLWPAIMSAGTMVFRDVMGDFVVETILPIIVQIVTGILAGQAVGAVLQQVAMTQLTKIISGAVGGVAAGTLLGTLLGGATGADPAAGGALGGLLGDAIGGAGGGAILTGIVGAVMKAMNK